MSRIQQILDKAAREGAVRHTQPEPGAPRAARVPAPVAPLPPRSRDALAAVQEPSPLPARPGAEPPVRVAAGARLDPLLVAALAPHAAAAEQYRALRTRISLLENGHGRRVILVTSPAKGDGKSITAANLALTMAQEYSRHVVLVDADLRRSCTHQLFGVAQEPGLADVLRGAATLEEALVEVPDTHLHVLPSGATSDQPAELLGSSAMRRVLDALRSRFDRVLIDVPPVVPLADAGVLAPYADGVIVVVRAGITPKPLIERALAAFDQDRLLGLVLNGTGPADAEYEAYTSTRRR